MFLYIVPDGVPQPGVLYVNSTAISLAWGDPERSNGVVKEYKLHAYYPIDDLGGYSQVVLKSGLFHEYVLSDLKPFANYSFWLEAVNEFGSSESERIHVVTSETGKFCLPIILVSCVNTPTKDITV